MSAPVLTDQRRMGGVVAQDGFDYQLWNALTRLPNWLANPAFDGFILEGFEDFEVRFFVPSAPDGYDHLVDRYQAKSAALKPAELREVVAQFAAFQQAYARVARSQVLVTPTLPGTLAWMGRDSDRVKRARPFYAPFPRVLEATDRQLIKDFTDAFGEDLGRFCVQNVDFEESVVPDRDHAEGQFVTALDRAFPVLDLSASRARAAFAALCDLGAARRGSLITRQDLTSVLVAYGVPHLVALPVRIRAAGADDDPRVFDVEGVQFAGGDAGYPPPTVWAADLLRPLVRLATWARSQGYARISLAGQFRLSTGFALGWAFRSAIGFDLDVPVRGGNPWRTDDHPTAQNQLPWRHDDPSGLNGDRLAIAIGVLRDPVPAILATQPGSQMLRIQLDQAIESARPAQESVRAIKTLVDAAVAQHRPTAIDLYFVGPAALAVALGHRWNGLPETQFHEFTAASGTYVPTLRVP